MKRLLLPVLLFYSIAVLAQSPFSLEAVKSYPFPTELTAAATGSRIAWAVNEAGKRNVYVAEGPDFVARKLTAFNIDDGQEITSLSLSPDGNWVVFVRGGDHGSNWDDGLPVNPSFTSQPWKVQLMSVPFAGGEAKVLAEGDDPVIAPQSDIVAFIKGGQVHTAPIDGAKPASSLFTTRGTVGSLEWSPDGTSLVFVSSRGDHALIGVFSGDDKPIQWVAPDFSHDRFPRWSPEGKSLVFVRTPGSGGVVDSMLQRRHNPWAIWTTDLETGVSKMIWQAPKTLSGSYPSTHGGPNLHWAANDRIVFLSYEDGWQHLYSLPSAGGKPLLLTPGNFMAEHIQLSPDRKWLVFSGNTGPDALDGDRRHVVRVPVDKPLAEVMTKGTGLEWTPVVTGDGKTLAFISATAQRPPLTSVAHFGAAAKNIRLIGESLLPSTFPKNLVTPRKITFKAPDGVTVHADVFESVQKGKRPAIVYVHGGPPRQMLLGWHYSDYYSNAYALNQYLCSLGFTVVSVNYRLGIGYGYAFHQPAQAGMFGASEYQDVKAAGEWLAAQPNVDATHIGVYGGSYGGFLTAMALARDSKLFAAGVDIHGVHDFVAARASAFELSPAKHKNAPDRDHAIDVAWQSSPIAYLDTWKSPVLIIHGDDDRNVRFNQSTDLVHRLSKTNVEIETMVIVDDTHHWMKHTNELKVDGAIASYLTKKLMQKLTTGPETLSQKE